MYLAWKHGGADPFRLYHNLDADYRPLGRPDSERVLPVYPGRVRNLIYGFAMRANEEAHEAMAAGAAKAGMR